MQAHALFQWLYLPGIFVFSLSVTLLSIEAGYRWAEYREKRYVKDVEAPVGSMVGALLGLLAFILGFTFSVATDAFHARKVAVVDEANTIRNVYQLAGMTPQPHQAEIRNILKQYVHSRLAWTGDEKFDHQQPAVSLQYQLWNQVNTVGLLAPGSHDLLLQYVSQLAELRTEREILRERSGIPLMLQLVLLILTILAHTAMGYHGGVAGNTRSPVMLLVAIAFSLVIYVIADIDEPGVGLINVSQAPMIDLKQELSAVHRAN